MNNEKIKKNIEKITSLRKENELLRRQQERNLETIKENRRKIEELQNKIKRNREKIQEAIELKKRHEKNIRFKSKHRVLNKVSGVLHVFGFPTYSISNSEYEIKKADELIPSLEKENESFFNEINKLEDQNLSLYKENDDLTEQINKINEEIEERLKENALVETENIEQYQREEKDKKEALEKQEEQVMKRELTPNKP